jgi:hypothetical protein
MSKPIRIIDARNKQYFVVDDVYLNGYARHLGPIASMIYISLCRHASKDQTSFPSQQLIATEIKAGVRSVVDKLSLLEKWNLISIERYRREDGKWLRNNYTLLDKSVWKRLPSATTAHGKPYANHDKNQVQPLHTKDTQREGYTTTGVDNQVDKICRWAYERANGTPSIPQEAFRRSVLKAVNRDGLDFVNKLFESEDNAIHFLMTIK